MIDDENLPPLEDEGSDTAVRFQGERETHLSGDGQDKATLPFEAGQLCGEFKLEKLLGRGSSGCVFRALDTVSSRSCALKILIRHNERDIRRDRIGFRRMMGLRHPNLLRVDQLHRLGDHIALSMEEIHGETLAKSRKRLRQLDRHIALGKLLSLTRDYASGLAAMHSNGLLHRDIKPSNLMVDRNDVGKVIDYGLVGTFDAELDSQCYRDYLAGTFRYISPEAYFDQHYTPAGDIFSLGLVILECLHAITGRDEWTRSKDDKSKDALLISSAVDDLSDSIPEVLREGCLEMLQVRAGDRPTAMQVARLGLPLGKSTIYMGGQPLFGRESEFERVCDWLGDIFEGGHGRLHIHGDPGIGKSGLIDAVERHLKSLRWGQVFRARCRPRDSRPMQAMDQFADQIASRYASNDRNDLYVDPVSAEILHQAFPVLKDVVKKSMRLPAMPIEQSRDDSLAAAVKLSVELRKVGPLILIVDDVQWADTDSNVVLDSLQAAGGPMLGIITVSRQKVSGQRKAPDQVMRLKPLSHEVGVRMLHDAARRWSVSISGAEIDELADVAGGNPFRLSELSDEFRPGGLLHSGPDVADSPLSKLGNLDRLCQHRITRLSDEARRLLPLIATADCAVSIHQLEMLTKLGDVIEIAVSELVNQRLAQDDATGGCCITMIHDRVCSGVIAKLGASECRAANQAWADLLRQESDAQEGGSDHSLDEEALAGGRLLQASKRAGRIARHLLDAGKMDEAVPFAKQAAIESEQAFAFCEAAQWHARVASLESKSRSFHLREAARLFVIGDEPTMAARCYQELAGMESQDRALRLSDQSAATKLLVQSGRFQEARETLNRLAGELNLPKLDVALPWLTVVTRGLRIFRGVSLLTHPIRKPGDGAVIPTEVAERLEFAQGLIRPLMLFNAPYATELFLRISEQVRQFGSVTQQLNVTIASAVFACSDGGARRNRGQALLREIQSAAMDSGHRATGDYWAAKTLASVLSMDWHAVEDQIHSAATAYKLHRPSCRQEISQTQWLNLWARWYLGDWQGLVSLRDSLIEDAQQRDDRITQFLASTGFASAAWLVDGDHDAIRDVEGSNEECFSQAGHLAEFLRFVSTMQQSLYHGQFLKAYEAWQAFDRQLSKSHLSRIQLARLASAQFGALIALHQFASSRDANWRTVLNRCLVRLRAERLPCAVVMAALYEGIACSISGEQDTSRKHLVAAQQLAKELHLLPFELAASDQLHHLETGDWRGVLRHRMHSSSVVDPGQLERIYTVGLKGISLSAME